MPLILDISGFEALFQVNYEALCASSYRIVQDKDIAEDIVQDVFYKLWKQRDAVTISIPLKSYLFQSTINHSLDYLKKYKSALKRESLLVNGVEDEYHHQEKAMAFKQISHPVDAAVNSLPETCRMVFILRRYENLSYREIALKLGLSVKGVENQMTKALYCLNKYLFTMMVYFFLFF